MEPESLTDLAPARAPLALATLHRATPPDARVTISLRSAEWPEPRLSDVIAGAGFLLERAERTATTTHVHAHRARMLPDTVDLHMRLLLVGLNPSLYTADAGVGYARPGNRFWPAALASGLLTRDRDPIDALVRHRVGMSNVVLRATAKASELSGDEYVAGAERLRRLVRWLRPGATCFVGLAGWRIAIDKRAEVGVQPEGFAGAPSYLMPNTSGLNAHAQLPDFVEHFRAAAALARDS